MTAEVSGKKNHVVTGMSMSIHTGMFWSIPGGFSFFVFLQCAMRLVHGNPKCFETFSAKLSMVSVFKVAVGPRLLNELKVSNRYLYVDLKTY